jgi:hypothetical protein
VFNRRLITWSEGSYLELTAFSVFRSLCNSIVQLLEYLSGSWKACGLSTIVEFLQTWCCYRVASRPANSVDPINVTSGCACPRNQENQSQRVRRRPLPLSLNRQNSSSSSSLPLHFLPLFIWVLTLQFFPDPYTFCIHECVMYSPAHYSLTPKFTYNP